MLKPFTRNSLFSCKLSSRFPKYNTWNMASYVLSCILSLQNRWITGHDQCVVMICCFRITLQHPDPISLWHICAWEIKNEFLQANNLHWWEPVVSHWEWHFNQACYNPVSFLLPFNSDQGGRIWSLIWRQWKSEMTLLTVLALYADNISTKSIYA